MNKYALLAATTSSAENVRVPGKHSFRTEVNSNPKSGGGFGGTGEGEPIASDRSFVFFIFFARTSAS